MIVAFCFDLIGLACELFARLRHLPYPYNTPLLYEAPGVDITNYARLFPYIHQPAFFDTVRGIRYQYPAPLAPLYGLFLSFSKPVLAAEATFIAILLIAAVAFGRHLCSRGLSIAQSTLIAGGALLLSYPVAFELKQGNLELFVCLLVGLGVWSFTRERWHLAAALFGIAGAMKIFPFIYLGLFLSRQRYRPLLTAVAAAAVVTVASLRYIDPNLAIAWHGVQEGVASYQTVFQHLVPQSSYDHSLFIPLKLLLRSHKDPTIPASLATVHRYLATVALTGVLLFFLRIWRLPLANQVLCLCVASILLPPGSYDYTLVHLYVPWAMLVCFAWSTRNTVVPGLTTVFAWLAIATSIQTELIVHGHSLQALIKVPALCALFWLGLRYPFKQTNTTRTQTDGGHA